MAPEILNGEKYNYKVDIWALGCIIHELCKLDFCFDNKSFSGLINAINETKHDKLMSSYMGKKCKI